MLLPALAWAKCTDGSDSGRFAEILRTHGAIAAVLASFGFGVIASLTPCVYPMVPITVSMFGATGSENGGRRSRLRGAALSATFVLGIATLFTPLGVASALTGRLMGSLLSNPWVVVGLAVLFAALAASMFGAFELALPSRITNRLGSVGGVGYKGAFAMGLVMGLVAAPCTGPFLTGLVTVIATTKNVALGSAALFAFALGLGVIFFVAGAFGANLPKSGAWMVGIKWVSGVGLLYIAFSYLRDGFEGVRDLVERPNTGFGVAGALALAIGAGLGIAHVIAERRRSPIAHLSRRLKLASIAPAFVGAAIVFTWLPLDHDVDPNVPAIAWRTDEAAAISEAQREGKPLLIDFGAHWCGACKELDRHTFARRAVRDQVRRFVALRIEATPDDDQEALQQKYNVVGLPTLILIDKTGHEVVRFNEPVEADRLVSALKCNFPSEAVAFDATAAMSQRL